MPWPQNWNWSWRMWKKKAFFITFAVELAKVLEPIENIAERSWDESMRQVDAHLQRQVFTFYTTHLFEFTLCPPVIKRNFMNYPLSSFRRRNERRHLTMTFQELTCPSICVSLPSSYSARNLPADFQLPVLTRSHFIWNLLINSIRECRWRWLHSFWKYSPSECFLLERTEASSSFSARHLLRFSDIFRHFNSVSFHCQRISQPCFPEYRRIRFFRFGDVNFQSGSNGRLSSSTSY